MRFLLLFLLAASAQAQDVASCWVFGPRSLNNDISVYPSMSALMFDTKNAAVIVTHSCETTYYYEPVVYVFDGEWLKRKTAAGIDLFKLKDEVLAVAKTDNMADLRSRVSQGQPLDQNSWADVLALHKRDALWEATGIKWYVVAKNGTRTDRPAFTYTANGRSTTASQTYRSPVGVLCRCHVKAFHESGGLYCEQGGHVTICVKKQPE